jgi:hypothetical protein
MNLQTSSQPQSIALEWLLNHLSVMAVNQLRSTPEWLIYHANA